MFFNLAALLQGNWQNAYNVNVIGANVAQNNTQAAPNVGTITQANLVGFLP